MGWIGYKNWAYDFLWPRHPKGYTPYELADLAIDAGIPTKAKNPWHSLGSTARRWTRPGDPYQDMRFGQRYEDGRLMIFAYPPNDKTGGLMGLGRAASDASESQAADRLIVDDLADLLVDEGVYSHKLDALRALGNLSLQGVAVPNSLVDDVRTLLKQEKQLQERKRELTSTLRAFLHNGRGQISSGGL